MRPNDFDDFPNAWAQLGVARAERRGRVKLIPEYQANGKADYIWLEGLEHSGELVLEIGGEQPRKNRHLMPGVANRARNIGWSGRCSRQRIGGND